MFSPKYAPHKFENRWKNTDFMLNIFYVLKGKRNALAMLAGEIIRFHFFREHNHLKVQIDCLYSSFNIIWQSKVIYAIIC